MTCNINISAQSFPLGGGLFIRNSAAGPLWVDAKRMNNTCTSNACLITNGINVNTGTPLSINYPCLPYQPLPINLHHNMTGSVSLLSSGIPITNFAYCGNATINPIQIATNGLAWPLTMRILFAAYPPPLRATYIWATP